MTDLDVYFWRFFALGAGFALVWRIYPWMALMGRAARYWFTIPAEARYVYDTTYAAMTELSEKSPHVLQQEWYRRYIAWREIGHIP
jgi:hypothetical protein